MDFNKSFTLRDMENAAQKQYSEIQERVGKMKNMFQKHTNGKTRASLVRTFLFTVVWGAAYAFVYTKLLGSVNDIALKICVGLVFFLLVVMIIDSLMNFKYYGKIIGYEMRIEEVRKKINNDKSTSSSKTISFMNSQKEGWEYPLRRGDSIYEDTQKIEEILKNIETFNAGALNKIKNIVYYILVVIVTFLGASILYDAASRIIQGIGGVSMEEDTLKILIGIAAVIACAIEIFVAYTIWVSTDCNVTNATLFAILLGPVIFIAFVLVVTLLVVLVVLLVRFILAILGIVLAGACLIGSLCGG